MDIDSSIKQLRIECSNCKQLIDIENESFLGQCIECPECTHEIRIPSPRDFSNTLLPEAKKKKKVPMLNADDLFEISLNTLEALYTIDDSRVSEAKADFQCKFTGNLSGKTSIYAAYKTATSILKTVLRKQLKSDYRILWIKYCVAYLFVGSLAILFFGIGPIIVLFIFRGALNRKKAEHESILLQFGVDMAREMSPFSERQAQYKNKPKRKKKTKKQIAPRVQAHSAKTKKKSNDQSTTKLNITCTKCNVALKVDSTLEFIMCPICDTKIDILTSST